MGEPTPSTDSTGQLPPVDAVQLINFLMYVLNVIRSSPALKLMACLAVDAFGFSSYLLPGLGEVADVGFAPFQAWFLYFMFGGVQIAAVGFFEEIFPGTDIVPTATLGWLSENVHVDAVAMEALRSFTGVPRRPRESSWHAQ